jgi:hypothetical protein
MGRIYGSVQAGDPIRSKYGYLTVMASSSEGQIGNLPAESFCERVFSNCNLILDDFSIRMCPDMVDILSTLRTNEKFMVKMKDRLPAILRDEKDEADRLRAGAEAAQGAESNEIEVTDDEEDDSDEFEDYRVMNKGGVCT